MPHAVTWWSVPPVEVSYRQESSLLFQNQLADLTILELLEGAMQDSPVSNSSRKIDPQSQRMERERRTIVRSETILSRIENATYAILRKYDKKPAC